MAPATRDWLRHRPTKQSTLQCRVYYAIVFAFVPRIGKAVPSMANGSSNTVQNVEGSPSESWRASLLSAAHFWEPRRIVYNILLIAVVVIWFAATWPHFLRAMNLRAFFAFFVLGLLANVCYSAAYLIDIPMRRSSLRGVWAHLAGCSM